MAARKRKKKSIAPKVILIVFVIFVSIVIVKNQLDAKRLNADTGARNEEIVTETMKRDRLRQELEEEIDNDYVLNEAQRQGYAAPNERIFVDTRGS